MILRQISQRISAPNGLRGRQSGDANHPARRRKNIEQQFQERAFSTAIGPDDAQRAAFFNGQGDLLEDQLLPVSKIQIFDLDDRAHGGILYAKARFNPPIGVMR